MVRSQSSEVAERLVVDLRVAVYVVKYSESTWLRLEETCDR